MPWPVAGWPKEKGRDGERTPMQWNAEANAGFAPAATQHWLPVPPNFTTLNVQAEESDPASLLAWYRSLIHLKKTNPAMATGENIMLDTTNDKVLSWMRQTNGAPTVVISANFTKEPQTVHLAIKGQSGKLKTLLKSPDCAEPVSLDQIVLAPFGVFIGELQ